MPCSRFKDTISVECNTIWYNEIRNVYGLNPGSSSRTKFKKCAQRGGAVGNMPC